jgi:hypothetical protein
VTTLPLEEPSVSEKLLASEGAKRLLADPVLQQLFTALIQDATQQAIFLTDPAEREAQRQLVLAIGHIRGSLEVAATWREQQAAEDHRIKSLE